MGKSRFLLLITVLGFQLLYAQPKIYPVDSWHSKIGFTAALGGLVDVDGTFTDFKGSILYDEGDLSTLSATILVRTESIDTDLNMRNEHLKEEEFLHVEKFPYMVFRSSAVIEKEQKQYMLGTLKLKGVTKEVEIEFKRLHRLKLDPWGNNRVSFEGKLFINQFDFGVGEKGDKWIGEGVHINFMISCRILNTDKIATLDHPAAQEICTYIEENGVDKGIIFAREQIKFHQEDKKVNSPKFLDFIALKYAQHDQLEIALKIYELNTITFPEEYWTYSNLANAYYSVNSKDKALENAKKALEMNDKDTQAIELIKWLNL